MQGTLRAVLVVGIVGCSTAGRNAAVVEELPPEGLASTTEGAFRGAGPGIAYAWAGGRVELTHRERTTSVRTPRPRGGVRPIALAPASISLETTELGRESGLSAVASAATPSLRQDGALVIDRGLAIERLEQRLAGMSQSWKLAAKPAGTGDLVFRVRAAGTRSAHADDAGIVLTTGAAGTPDARSFRYGTATWIDATGQSVRIAPTVDGGTIEIRVPSALVDASSFPATLDPIVSAEGFGPTQIATPRVAGTGSSYVAVWQDLAASTARLVTARVDATTGAIQRPFAVPVSGATPASDPAITAAGAGFLLAYTDNAYPASIRARWLDASGAPAGADFAVSGTYETVSLPSVACAATRCLVAYQEFAQGVSQIRYAYVDRMTSAVSANIALTNSRAAPQRAPDVASDGANFLVAWSSGNADGDAIAAARVGAAIITTTVALETTPTWYRSVPRVAFGGGKYFVTYADWRTEASVDVFAKRVEASTGALLDAAALTIATSPTDEDVPTIGSDGARAFISYANTDGVYGAVLSGDGTVSPNGLIGFQAGAVPEAMAATSSGLLSLWSGRGDAAWQAFGVRIQSNDGSPVDASPIAISAGPGICSAVSVAATPNAASAAGAIVELTASSTCTDASPEYQFWVENPGVGFSMLRDFAALPTATWSTTNLPTDAYRIIVRARRAGLFANYESEAEIYHGIVGAHGVCSQLTSSAAPADFVTSGSTVNLAGASTCTGGAEPEYQYRVTLPNGIGWVLRDWGTSTYDWSTGGFPNTSLSIDVRSRRVGSDATFEAESHVPMLVMSGPGHCPIVRLSSSTNVMTFGSSVTLTASADCTSGESPEYEFVVRPPTGSMQVLRAYGPSATAEFTAAGGVSGTYRVWVRARRAGSALPLEARAGTMITVQ